jgi:prevent-host-death family protein
MCTVSRMEVAITTLRADLSNWIERARAGEEIVVTDRGLPVARLLPVDTSPILEQLVANGIISGPRRAKRPAARGAGRVRATGPVAELVSEQRD